MAPMIVPPPPDLTSYLQLGIPYPDTAHTPSHTPQGLLHKMLRVTGVRLAESVSKIPLNLREASASLLPPLPYVLLAI